MTNDSASFLFISLLNKVGKPKSASEGLLLESGCIFLIPSGFLGKVDDTQGPGKTLPSSEKVSDSTCFWDLYCNPILKVKRKVTGIFSESTIQNTWWNRAQWHPLIILALGRLTQEDPQVPGQLCVFKTSLGYMARPWLTKQNETKNSWLCNSKCAL